MQMQAAVILAEGAKSAAWSWLYSLGGFGLILLAFLDNSVIPLPGSMDLLTIVLTAHHPDLWWYYAGMATIGSLLGAYPTYRLGEKGGKESLGRKVSKERMEKVYAAFDRKGAWAIAVPSLIPPPFPLSPFLAAAGALHLPLRKFFGALALGRGVRYFLVAWLGAHYSKQLLGFFSRYYRPILWAGIALGVASALTALGAWWWHKRKQHGQPPATQPQHRAA
jgi:membrane protein YqaA with SNARE-associated domain